MPVNEPARPIPYDATAELCEDFGCPFFVKQPGCRGESSCPRIEEHRKQRGAVYLLVGQRKELFVAFLARPGKRH